MSAIDEDPVHDADAVEIEVSETVAAALDDSLPLVALESTIFSELGLPAPFNREAFDRCHRVIEANGAVPALTAVRDGRLSIGVFDPDVICGPARKAAARDLGVALGQQWPYGATTVSGALTVANQLGIEVFATGGIGGVHRGWGTTGDISADLDTIAKYQMITVSAGAKIFLDLPATLERLETLGVIVLGWQCDEFPAFHTQSSGLPVPHRVESADEVARIAHAHWSLGGGGILVVAPVPDAASLDAPRIQEAVEVALATVAEQNIRGAAITPVVLAGLAEATDGDSVPTNLALAENNAQIAAAIAVALGQRW